MKGPKNWRQDIVTAVGAAVLATGLSGYLAGTALADPKDYTFTRLATVSGPSPGPDMFDFDFEPYAINAAGNLAFVADLKGGGTDIGEGVFASRQGQLLQIMGPGQGHPGGEPFLAVPLPVTWA